MRGGRVIERVELVTEASDAAARSARSEVLQAAVQQFYEDRPAPPEVHVPVERSRIADDARGLAVASAPAAACAWSCPSAARSAGCWSWRRATPRWPTSALQRRATGGHYDALETLRVVLALPALPRRIECFDISTIQGSETVASMVVCEDGRMKRSEYRKFESRDLAAAQCGPQGQRPRPRIV